jgi:hypothetical protein
VAFSVAVRLRNGGEESLRIPCDDWSLCNQDIDSQLRLEVSPELHGICWMQPEYAEWQKQETGDVSNGERVYLGSLLLGPV